MRIFIAVRPDDQVIEDIFMYIQKLKPKVPGVKWVEKENLHVTLKFLGEMNTGKLGELAKKLERSLAGQSCFEVSFSSLGAFPNLKKARTLWIEAKDSGQLRRISEIIDKDAIDIMANIDDRFHPHLTIGRVKGESFEFTEDVSKNFGKSVIEEILIIESRLTPKGPIYTDLAKIKL